MTGIKRNIVMDEDQMKRVKYFNRGDSHVWQAMFKDNPESNRCDFKVSCIDRDALLEEIEKLRKTMSNCKQIGSIQYVAVDSLEMDKYVDPIIEGFNEVSKDINRCQNNTHDITSIFDKVIKIKRKK